MLEVFQKFFKQRVSGDIGMPRISKKAFNVLLTWLPRDENLEPDAKYFLIYNVHFMLIAPLQAKKRSFRLRPRPIDLDISYEHQYRQDYYMFERDLAADIDNIVAHAKGIARYRDRTYVSSTSVAMALGELAPELKTARWQVWGPRREEFTVV